MDFGMADLMECDSFLAFEGFGDQMVFINGIPRHHIPAADQTCSNDIYFIPFQFRSILLSF